MSVGLTYDDRVLNSDGVVWFRYQPNSLCFYSHSASLLFPVNNCSVAIVDAVGVDVREKGRVAYAEF